MHPERPLGRPIASTARCLILLAACTCAPPSVNAQAAEGSAGQPIQVGDEKPSAETAHGQPAAAAGPRSAESKVEREAMVAQQIEARGVRSPDVLAAMRHVPRHWFVPEHLRNLAYSDQPLPIGEDQTISQPYMVALMTESLKLTRESKVLEIGTGSGYQAAVLSEITPHVFTIEIVEPLARRAIDTLEQRGYRTVKVRIGDGYAGWPEHAPFDAIIVTCAPDHIPPKLTEQLKAGGRMCIPVGSAHGVQELVLTTKNHDGTLGRRTLIPVRFVPMTGAARE